MVDNALFPQFKDNDDKEAFIVAQYKTIVEQSKKISQQQEEIVHLKKLLASSTPLIEGKQETLPMMFENDEECIARMELKKLREVSLSRELTMEEARKMEIYTKIIHGIRKDPKKLVLDAKKVPKEDLLASLEGADDE